MSKVRYQTSVYLGMDPNTGKPINRRITASSKAELNRKKRELKKGIKEKQVRKEKHLYEFYRTEWLKIKKLEVGEGHYRSLVQDCNYLKRFDDIPIDQITAEQYFFLLSELAKENPHTHKPSSKKLLIDIRRCAYNIHESALRPGPYQTITYNVVKDVKIPKTVSPTRRKPITEEQQKWIRDTPHECQTAAMIMLYAGLRKGEVIALSKDDLDLNQKIIHVNKAARFSGKNVLIGKPKTEAGIRAISIPDLLVQYLKKQNFQKTYIAFDTEEPVNKLQFEYAWKRYMTALDVKYGDRKNKYSPKGKTIETFTPHQLRHTYCTMLFDAGIDAETARNLMGHESVSTTLDIYTHLNRTHMVKEISALNNFLGQKIN